MLIGILAAARGKDGLVHSIFCALKTPLNSGLSRLRRVFGALNERRNKDGENYEKYFGKDGEEKMTAKERAAAENYEITCNDFWMLNCMFEQLYYEFQIQAHRSPHFVVNAYKIQLINKILVPLKRLMEGKPYGAYLEIPEEPAEVVEEELLVTTGVDPADGNFEEQPVRARKTKLAGLDYSDVALVLTQYKGAMKRFAADCL